MTSRDELLGSHVDPDLLAALALDETDSDVGPQARAHVAACASCADEVAALRETMALISAGRSDTFPAPPPSVWEAVQAEIDRPAAVIPIARRRRVVPTWLATTAAAVALAAGVGLGAWVVQPDDPAPQAQVVGSTALASLDTTPQERGAAEVRRHDDRVVLHVEAVDLGGPQGTREVWLINLDGTRMVSLGLLGEGESGDFDFPERLLDEGYRIVDISYEPDDGDPVHSGKSLARGTLAT